MNDGGGLIQSTSFQARSGTRSLRISNTGAADWVAPQVSQTFPAAEGDVINFHGYMRTNSTITDGSFGLLKIVFKDINGNDLLPASIDAGTLNTSFPGIESIPLLDGASTPNQWILSQAQGEAPVGTAAVVLFALNVNPPGSSTTMYFDDLYASVVGDLEAPPLTAAMSGTDVELSFPTEIGVVYEVAYKNDLTDATWTVIDTIAGDGTEQSVTYAVGPTQRYYVVQIK